jgi:hypothetical protein
MPHCYICERGKRKGEECESCNSFFCEECVETYCVSIDFESECHACNGEDDDCCSFMGEKLYTGFLPNQQFERQTTMPFTKSKVPMGRRFYKWFIDNKLESYKVNGDDNKYHFPKNKLIDNIIEFYGLKTQGNKRIIIENNLNFIYNCIIREYEPDEFERYKDHQNRIYEAIGSTV